MDGIFLLVGLCIATLAGLGGYSYLRARGQVSRLLARVEQTPVSPVATAEPGPVAIQGRAEALETIHSPLQERDVLADRIKVADNTDDAPVILVDTGETADFLVVDGSGKALVNADGAMLLCGADVTRNTGALDRAPAALRVLLAKRGHSTRGWLFERSLAWSESVLEHGDEVYVCGHARREVTQDEEPKGYREAPSRLVLEQGRGQQVVVADRHREDVVSLLRSYQVLPEEWMKR